MLIFSTLSIAYAILVLNKFQFNVDQLMVWDFYSATVIVYKFPHTSILYTSRGGVRYLYVLHTLYTWYKHVIHFEPQPCVQPILVHP